MDQPDRDLVRDHHQAGHPPGTFTSVNALIRRIRAYVDYWNTDAEPFAWTATADEILAKVRWVETNVKKLVANNSK